MVIKYEKNKKSKLISIISDNFDRCNEFGWIAVIQVRTQLDKLIYLQLPNDASFSSVCV